MFSLIDDIWLPVMHKDGRRSKIKPEQITDKTIIELDYPRPDFQGAAYQFLIGLLQTTFAPEDVADWDAHWDEIPIRSTLHQAFNQVKHAMNFGADKPAFMQDFDLLSSEPISILGLLIEAPGDNTLKHNKDHFIKRDTVQCMCEHCAAMALFTLQINAPAGGQGHRTGMRGGGPITTLIMPEFDSQASLWHKLWLNVYPEPKKNVIFDLSIFPWLASTQTSDKKDGLVTPEMANELQAYWGMPRRIELDFGQTKQGLCDICGQQSERLLTQYRTKNYGIQYDGWIHPLSPYRQALKEGSPLLAVKGQPGGLVYRDWLGLISNNSDRLNCYLPAKIMSRHAERFRDIRAKTGLWCFGYDMDNRKARCWYEHHFPLIILSDDCRDSFNSLITLILELATNSLSLLRSAIKDAKGDNNSLNIAYWQETEAEFLTLANRLYAVVTDPQLDKSSLLIHWRDYLRDYVFNAFIQRVFSDPDNKDSLDHKVEAYLSLRRQFFKQKPLQAINGLAGIKKESKHG